MKSIVAIVLVLCGVILVFWGIGRSIQLVANPWSWTWFNKNSILGEWSGQFKTEKNEPLGTVFMKLHLPYRLKATSNLDAELRICRLGESRGREYGGTSNGAAFHIKLHETPNLSESVMSVIDGEMHNGMLKIKGTLLVREKGGALQPVEITGELKRGAAGEFDALCTRQENVGK